MLFDRLEFLPHLEMVRRAGADAPGRRREAATVRADRSRQHRRDWIGGWRSSAPLRSRRFMAMAWRSPLIDQRRPSLHRAQRSHDPVVLLQPALLPVGLRLGDRQRAVGAEHVRIPVAPFAGAPPRRTRRARAPGGSRRSRRRGRAAISRLRDRRRPRSGRRASTCGGRRRDTISASRPKRIVPKLSESPIAIAADDHGRPAGRPASGRNSG